MDVGVVGFGKMGVLHAGILNALEGVRVTAIAERDGVLRNYVKKIFPHIKMYDDASKMCEQAALDIVYITTPVLSHLPVAISCIKNNINFFMEKPLAANLGEAKKLCQELCKHDVIHSVGYNRRFTDTFVKAKELLDLDTIGEVHEVNSSIYLSTVFSKTSSSLAKKAERGGVLLDLGIHVVDLLIWYFGYVKKVSGHTSSTQATGTEDSAHIEIEFENKVRGAFDTSWSVQGYRLPEINLEISGSNGKMRVSDDFIETDLKKSVPHLKGTKMKIYKQQLCTPIPFDLGGADYVKEDLYMVNCVREKRQSFVNVFEATKSQSVIEAMHDCVGSGEQEVEYIDKT